MGVFYFEDKELPEYTTDNSSNVLKVSADGVYLEWLTDNKELPVNAVFTTTAFNNGATTSNGVNMMTLNQNGPSNFNTFTPNFSQILTPSTNTGIDPPGTTSLTFGLGVNPSNGVWVVTSNTETAGEPRIYVSGESNTSNYLTSWTEITNTIINVKNLRSVVYANGIWAVCSSENTSRQLYYTTDATAKTGWTQTAANTAPWNGTATPTRMKFLNGQFVVLLNASKYRVSTDCITWSEVTINATSYNLQDIEYSPQLRRYVIPTSSAGILYYSGSSLPTSGSNMFTFVSIANGASNTISWSPKLGMFLTTPLNAPRNLINISNDGITWSQYSANGTWGNLARIGQWFNEFGGFFIIIVQQTAPQCAISRDGLTWSFVSFSFSGTGNSIAFDSTSKTFMMSGTDVVHFKRVSSAFNSFIDPDTVYNTFNSNTRFRDVIEYDTQTITTASGYAHFTPTSFNRPTINFDTTNSNANIYLQGSSFNGRIGTKFRITKTVSTNNGVRIHAYEPVRIISPLVNMLNFNLTSPITVYDFIPQTYFGSFDLTRVNDETNEIYTGTWLVDNVAVYPLLGGEYVPGNLTIGHSLIVKNPFNPNDTIMSVDNSLIRSNRLLQMGTQLELQEVGSAYRFAYPSVFATKTVGELTNTWKLNFDADYNNPCISFILNNSTNMEIRQSITQSYKNFELKNSNLVTAPRIITNASVPQVNTEPSPFIWLNTNSNYEPILHWGNATSYPIGTTWEVFVNNWANNVNQKAYFLMGTSPWTAYQYGTKTFKVNDNFYADINALYKIIVLDHSTTNGITGNFVIFRLG